MSKRGTQNSKRGIDRISHHNLKLTTLCHSGRGEESLSSVHVGEGFFATLRMTKSGEKLGLTACRLPFVVCCLLLTVHCLTGDEIEGRYFRTNRHTDQGFVPVDNFKFDHSALSFEISDDNWSGFYFKDNAIAHYYHRSEQDCSIEVRQIPLKETPQDEKRAREIYEAALLKNNPGFMIRGGRSSEEVKFPSAFPVTYTLATGANEPPIIMNTVFVHPPYLYSVKLKVASELKGPLRKELYSLLRSICISPREGTPTNAPAPGGTATPNAPNQFSPIIPQ